MEKISSDKTKNHLCVTSIYSLCIFFEDKQVDSFEGILNKHCFCGGGQEHRLPMDFFFLNTLQSFFFEVKIHKGSDLKGDVLLHPCWLRGISAGLTVVAIILFLFNPMVEQNRADYKAFVLHTCLNCFSLFMSVNKHCAYFCQGLNVSIFL